MADINQQAIIEIEINGQKAKKELNNYRTEHEYRKLATQGYSQ